MVLTQLFRVAKLDCLGRNAHFISGLCLGLDALADPRK